MRKTLGAAFKEMGILMFWWSNFLLKGKHMSSRRSAFHLGILRGRCDSTNRIVKRGQIRINPLSGSVCDTLYKDRYTSNGKHAIDGFTHLD